MTVIFILRNVGCKNIFFIGINISLRAELIITKSQDWIFISCHNTYRDAFGNISPHQSPKSWCAGGLESRLIALYFSISTLIFTEKGREKFFDIEIYREIDLDIENYRAIDPDAQNYEEIYLDIENYRAINLDARNYKEKYLYIKNYGEIDEDTKTMEYSTRTPKTMKSPTWTPKTM